jgi:hypothetical protein
MMMVAAAQVTAPNQPQMMQEQETLAVAVMPQTPVHHSNSERMVGEHKLLSVCKYA